MQKGSNSSKKVIASNNPVNIDNYKSESNNKGSGNAGKGKEGMAFQNMKEFKCEIDHEIAKCLDTLDRQGLKFLKETLRASKIFGLNTLELGLTQPVQQHIDIDQESPPKPKEKQVPKKIESTKNNVQIKKVSKPEPIKKIQPVATKPSKSQGKNDLNQKINKRLENLNIKTGKKNQPKISNKKDQPIKKQKVQANNIQIAEQIEVQEAELNANYGHLSQSSKVSESSHSKQQILNPSHYESSKQWSRKEGQSIELTDSREKIQQNSLLKPFCKKQFKKHHQQNKHHKQHKDYGIQISQPEQFKKQISEKSDIENKESLTKRLSQEPIAEKQIVKEQLGGQPQIKQQTSPTPIPERKQPSQADPYIQNLISAISRLSPSKRNKLEKIIQKLQNSEKYEATSSFVSNPQKNEVTYQKPYIAQRQSFAKNSQVKQNHSKSRTKLEKVEKATSLKTSLIKRMQGNSNLTPQNHGNLTPTMRKKVQKIQSPNEIKNIQNNVLQMYDDAKSQFVSEYHKETMKNSQLPQQKPEKSKELQSSANLSASYHSQLNNQSQTGQKLIKINKKRNQTTNIIFKILSNNGHSSLVGLTSIQIFNPQGQIITIDETNLRSSTPKLIKLFSDNVRGQGWFTTLSNATITIESISQQVAGIRIINWNKSELQVDRQADMMEIWINDQLHWRGQIKSGSYKESEVYATNIKVMQRHFQFPEIKSQPNKSFTSQQKPSFKNQSVKNVQLILEEPIQKKEKQEVCWLQKQSVEKQLKFIEQQQKKDEKIKKISSIRNTVANKNINDFRNQVPSPKIERNQIKPFDFGLNWLNNQQFKQKNQKLRYEAQVKPNLKPSHEDDILGQLSKGVEIKRKKQQSSLSIGKRKEEPITKVKQESASKRHQEYLLKKQKQQDEQFEKILLSMQQRSKPQQLAVITPKKKQVVRQKEVQNLGKLVAQKNFEDFMKDSLFDEKPKPRKFQNKGSRPILQPEEKKQKQIEVNNNSKKNINMNQLDDLIDELNDVVGGEMSEQTGEEFYIPQLPTGREISIVLLSNWGNQAFIGLNGIEIFDSDGATVKPVALSCTCMNSKQLFQKLFKQELLTNDEKIQLKFQKGKKIAITLTFSEKIQIAALRIWNYNGHRVHNNIGVKKLHIKLDNSFIFSGDIQQSSGSSQDAYKYCEYILFTQNNNILKKIGDNDWMNRINRKEQEERLMFKTTLEHFHRPVTRNDEEAVKKQIQDIQIQKQPIKLPKRQCFQYDPPVYLEGFVLKFVLHNSWGDRFFIGLNGIQVFNDKGENITNKNLMQVRADPSSISKLEGYQKDKRVVANLINGKNNTTSDANIWLAPLLSDVQKIEKGRPNIILLEYNKPNKIAGINFYNYTKTPERGVREIEIFLDNYLLYRGYLRKAGSESSGIIHTTINFTKQQAILEAINYVGYNEDHLQQEVALINQEKIIKANAISYDANLIRPMTGKLNY